MSCHLFLLTEILLDTASLSYATVRNLGTSIIVTFFIGIFYPLAQQIPLVIGIIIGIKRGNIGELFNEPKPHYRIISWHDKQGNYHFRIRINWSKFIQGFLIGLSIYGLYTLGGLNELDLLGIYQFLILALMGAIIIGFITGSIYGFGPTIFALVKSLPDYRLGQIGVFLTVLGIIFLAVPSLF